MEREVLKLTPKQGRSIVYDQYYLDSEENEVEFELIYDNITDTSRWSEHHDIVVKRKSDGKFFSSGYSQGLTEVQDESPYEYSEAKFYEVFPVEETIIVYK